MNKKGRIDIILILWLLFACFLCSALGWYLCIFYDSGIERASPIDRITEENMYFTNDSFCFVHPNITVARLTGTNSMDPIFDIGHNLVEIKPKSIEDIHVGDIVAVYSPYIEKEYNISTMVHRVIKVDMIDGRIKTRGDNNKANDGWVPYDYVQGIIVGIIY